MILRGRLPLFVVCLVLAVIVSEARGRAAGAGAAGVPPPEDPSAFLSGARQ